MNVTFFSRRFSATGQKYDTTFWHQMWQTRLCWKEIRRYCSVLFTLFAGDICNHFTSWERGRGWAYEQKWEQKRVRSIKLSPHYIAFSLATSLGWIDQLGWTPQTGGQEITRTQKCPLFGLYGLPWAELSWVGRQFWQTWLWIVVWRVCAATNMWVEGRFFTKPFHPTTNFPPAKCLNWPLIGLMAPGQFDFPREGRGKSSLPSRRQVPYRVNTVLLHSEGIYS